MQFLDTACKSSSFVKRTGDLIFVGVIVVNVFIVAGVSFAESIELLGGSFTSTLSGRNALQLPAPAVVDENRRQTQMSGFGVFHRVFRRTQGLGPRFMNRSCGGCHVNNGRGPVGFSPNRLLGNAMVVRVTDDNHNVAGIGAELREQDTRGRRYYRLHLTWEELPGKYPDGMSYSLRRPLLSYSVADRHITGETLLMTPPVVGAGLVDAIPEEVILERSDPEDRDRDSVSGRPNYVPENRSGRLLIGKFGYKASQPTLEQQAASAFKHDMGITTSLLGRGVPELSDDALERVVFYLAFSGVPQQRTSSGISDGQRLFTEIGCEQCHRMTIPLGATSDERSNQVIHPFSDFLLHDMGKRLASTRPEFRASGREWRTSPLWGIGYGDSVSSVSQRYLHDGRARTLEEAILWHGGEGVRARDRFRHLTERDRELILEFLRSL